MKELKHPKINSPEIDEGLGYCSYQDALSQVMADCCPIGIVEIPLDSAVGCIATENVIARVNSPSADVSFKDGFAIISGDIEKASPTRPVKLEVIGSVFAGERLEGCLKPGKAIRICSGSPIPQGATAVVAEEFCRDLSREVLVMADAEPGRNLLRCGDDVKSGEIIVRQGHLLHPGQLGLMAAAGISHVKVFRKPQVLILAIGDEVVAPGDDIQEGQVFASNMVTMGAWLTKFGLEYRAIILNDDPVAIRQALEKETTRADMVLTSGGSWSGERDLAVRVMDELGWTKRFHRVRLGPGKGIAFGIWNGKPVFCLPGGPSSNENAFLQLALPGLLRMVGGDGKPFLTIWATLMHEVRGRHRMWAEFKDARLTCDGKGNYCVTQQKGRSRLKDIANNLSMICVPEGVERLDKGERIPVQLLVPAFGGVIDS